MNELVMVESGNKFTHASVGALRGFEGKQFVKEVTGATSCEISFGTLPSGESVPFSTHTREMRKIT